MVASSEAQKFWSVGKIVALVVFVFSIFAFFVMPLEYKNLPFMFGLVSLVTLISLIMVHHEKRGGPWKKDTISLTSKEVTDDVLFVLPQNVWGLLTKFLQSEPEAMTTFVLVGERGSQTLEQGTLIGLYVHSKDEDLILWVRDPKSV